jgi:hypothetical protein
LAALLGTSCTSALNTVEGEVRLKNQPIERAVVTFHPVNNDDIKTIRPSGVTDANGKFTLSSGLEPGAAPGEYLVTVTWLKQPPASTKKILSTEPPPEPDDALQGRYADNKASKIKVTIKAGHNKLEPFNLE